MKWRLEKYGFKEGNKPIWNNIEPDKGSIFMQLQGTQITVIQDAIVHESIMLIAGSKDIRGVAKEPLIVLCITTEGTTRRLRFKFAPSDFSSRQANWLECIQQLERFISVKHNTEPPTRIHETIAERYNGLMRQGNIPGLASLPIDFNIEESLRLCILDPSFPSLVDQVDKIIKFNQNR